jgi:ABC-type multidrug transport system fused ATPase/permease subunit
MILIKLNYKDIYLVEPWIFSGTIRQNILFGLDYDAHKFNRCIHLAALNIVCYFFIYFI